MTRTATPMTMLDHALQSAAMGSRIFPCHSIFPLLNVCDCHKPNCGSPGKHPRIKQWPKRATTDADQIRRWWKKWPDANIGIATGNGLLVVDVDIANGKQGQQSLAALEQECGAVPLSWSARSGSGGCHYYVRLPAGILVRSQNGFRPGLDLKSEGGFVIAPPSRHASGQSYVWECQVGNMPPMLPSAWLQLLPQNAEPPVPLDKWYTRGSQAEETDNPDSTDTSSILSGLSVSPDTAAGILSAVQVTVPTTKGIRNSRLVWLARSLYAIEELRDKDAEWFEPVIRAWLEAAIVKIGHRDFDQSWGEWLYIWGAWLKPTSADELVTRSYTMAINKPFPPMPDSYRSQHLRQLVALCAALHENAADEDRVWFISCRKAAAVIGLGSNYKPCAAFFRRLVKDGILEAVGERKPGSMKAQRYKYLGYDPQLSEQRSATESVAA